MHYDRFVTHSPQQSSLLFARLNSHLYLSKYLRGNSLRLRVAAIEESDLHIKRHGEKR
jgi:hypothetical protein